MKESIQFVNSFVFKSVHLTGGTLENLSGLYFCFLFFYNNMNRSTSATKNATITQVIAIASKSES